jgi:hypothetical protein
VIAFEKFLGILIPKDAINGTNIIEVSLPGTQPIQCLSATIVHLGYLKVTQFSAIAFAVKYISLLLVV